jgi:hypothetical protein
MVDEQPLPPHSEEPQAAWHWLLERCNHEAGAISEGREPSDDLRALIAAALQMGGSTVLEPTRGLLNLVRYCILNEIEVLATPSQDYVAAYLYGPHVAKRGLAVAPGNFEQFERAVWIEAREGPITARALAKRVGIDHKTVTRWRKHVDWPVRVLRFKRMGKSLDLRLRAGALPTNTDPLIKPDD